MTYEILPFFILVIFLASVFPGPNVLIVLTNAYSFGIRGAYFTIVGNITCLFFVALLAAVGVGSIISSTPSAYILMKVVGGIYLGWLGLKMITNTFKSSATAQEFDIESQRISRKSFSFFSEGFFVSASNPKSILFLSAVFPQFIDESTPLIPQFILMFATIIVVVTIIHSAYAFAASGIRGTKISPSINKWASRLAGAVFVAFGIAMTVVR